MIGSVVGYRKVYIPRQEQLRVRRIEKILEDAQVKAEIPTYEVPVDSPLWIVAQTYNNYLEMTKKAKKVSVKPVLQHTIENMFPSKFSSDDEKTLIGICMITAEHKHYEVLAPLAGGIHAAINAKSFSLSTSDFKFMMQCWSLSHYLTKEADATEPLGEVLGDAITKLETLSHLQEELMPYLAEILIVFWAMKSEETKTIEKWFKKTLLNYRIEFLNCLHGVDFDKDKTPLMLLIACTIAWTDILDRPEQDWDHLVSRIISAGFERRALPLSVSGLKEVPFQDRFHLASLIIEHKTAIDAKDPMDKILKLKKTDYKDFFNYNVPQPVTKYAMDSQKRGVRTAATDFILHNKTSIMDVIYDFQQGNMTTAIVRKFLEDLPETSVKQIRGEANTRSILRHTVGKIILDRIKARDYSGISSMLPLFGTPYDMVVDALDNTIENALVTTRNDRNLQDFIMSLQSALIESGASKAAVKKISHWLKMWGVIETKTRSARSDYEHPAHLLEVIEETKAEFATLAIAEQCLQMIDKTAESAIRIFVRGEAGLTLGIVQNRRDEAKKRLEAIKKAYYKLQLISQNTRLKLSEAERTRLISIAEQLLAFAIKVRRQDFLDRMKVFLLEAPDVLDIGHLIKSSIDRGTFVFFPEPYHSFALPALRVINEFLVDTSRLPVVGSRQTGIIIKEEFWLFGMALSFAFMPLAIIDREYANFLIEEYLKTTSLAIKKAEAVVERALVRIDPDLTPEKLLVNTLKNMSDMHLFQGIITREMVIEALEFGGWDTSLADRVIEERKYCIYCSFALPDDAEVCPNCDRKVEELDLAAIAGEDIEIDLADLGVDISESDSE
jgi:hypothetical protein